MTCCPRGGIYALSIFKTFNTMSWKVLYCYSTEITRPYLVSLTEIRWVAVSLVAGSLSYDCQSAYRVFCCIRDPFDQFNIYCLSNIIHPATPSPDDTCNFYLHTACRNTFFTTAICQWPTCCSNYRIMAARPSVNNFWFDPVEIKLIITSFISNLLTDYFFTIIPLSNLYYFDLWLLK